MEVDVLYICSERGSEGELVRRTLCELASSGGGNGGMGQRPREELTSTCW